MLACRANRRVYAFFRPYPLLDAATPSYGSTLFTENGVGILELAIILPFFLVLLAGVIDIGSKIKTDKIITSASAYGARIAAAHSHGPAGGKACGVPATIVCPGGPNEMQIPPAAPVAEAAAIAACNFIRSSNLKPNEWEVTPSVNRSAIEDGASFFTVSVKVEAALETCLFCYDGIFKALHPQSVSMYVLENACA